MANDTTTTTLKTRRACSEPAEEPRALETIGQRYQRARRFSEALCEPLVVEDFVIQSMPDVSPTRWHLAHTTWFFETLVLSKALVGYRPFHPAFIQLFNSYYNSIGDPFPRSRRGLLSRPTVKEVFEYRAHVDEHMHDLLRDFNAETAPDLARAIETGIGHEEQHQELALTDIKHVFSCNPLHPVYRRRDEQPVEAAAALRWVAFDEGLHWIGHEGAGFAYDNEMPRHREFVAGFELASRLVTNGEFLEFIDDGGYERPEHWLSEGWTAVRDQGWQAPLYWMRRDGDWWNHTLSGLHRVANAEPVCHVSYFEADAYARWAGARLPTEAAWEVASTRASGTPNFAEDGVYHPTPATDHGTDGSLSQCFGDVWEWTCSPYVAYPGYEPVDGALGEYNGKFMCNQMVLRGGSCATPHDHIRPTYRNYFPPAARWQFSGIRLSR